MDIKARLEFFKGDIEEGCYSIQCNDPFDPVEYECGYEVEFECEECIFCECGGTKDPRKVTR